MCVGFYALQILWATAIPEKVFMFKILGQNQSKHLCVSSPSLPCHDLGNAWSKVPWVTAADISLAWLLPKLSEILPKRHINVHTFCSKFTVPNFTEGIPDLKIIKSQGALSPIVSPEVSHHCRISCVYWLDRMLLGGTAGKAAAPCMCELIVTKGHNFNMLKTKSPSWASGRVLVFLLCVWMCVCVSPKHSPRSKGKKLDIFPLLTWVYPQLTQLRASPHAEWDDADFQGCWGECGVR